LEIEFSDDNEEEIQQLLLGQEWVRIHIAQR
jgi:hypothetical protein